MSESAGYLGAIDRSVDTIELRFVIKNVGATPVWEWDGRFESRQKHAEKKARRDGDEETRRFIDATPETGLAPFLEDLKTSGFEMIRSSVVKREQDDIDGIFSVSWIFHFIFGRERPGEEFAEKRSAFYEPALRQFVSEAMWRVRAFRNPGFGMRDGKYGISINLEVRQPYKGGDGKMITRRPLDGRGKKILTADPVPLSPAKLLRIVDSEVKLVP